MGISMPIWKSCLCLSLAWIAFAIVPQVGRAAAQPSPAAKPVTIQRIVEERERTEAMPKNLAWSPDGKLLSFIRTTTGPGKVIRGVPIPGITSSEIWSIDAVTGAEKLLMSRAQLNSAFSSQPPQAESGGEEDKGAGRNQLQEYSWARGGRALLLATSSSLAWFDLGAHTSRSLQTGEEELSYPEISPDGRFVSFIRDHSLWLADAATGAAHAFTHAGTSDMREGEPDWVYLHELGLRTAYWWSPDASSVAWIETDDRAVDKYSLRSADGDERMIAYPKPGNAIPAIHLFVQAVSGGTPVQIDLGSDPNVYIPRVKWLPDGKHLAIERLSRSQKILDLLLADPATGATSSILTEKDAYWINLSDDLHFLKDSQRFLWSSERSGYRHLYMYDISGRQLAQLTKGDWEVTSLAGVDETAGVAYFMATEASPFERQLYSVKLDGSGFTRITRQKGTHGAFFSPSGSVFLDTWSDHASPPRQDLLQINGSKIGSIEENPPGDLAANPPSPLEFLTVKTHMGLNLNAWMMKPTDFDPARHYPSIFYVAGGPGDQIVRDAWGGDILLWFTSMAQKGYVVFALDNRGSAGRGHLFEEPVHLRFSGTEMSDIRDEVLYLRSQPWIDPARIGICGWGFGGFLALHGMLDPPMLFKAGFAGSPVTDWHLYDAVFAERYLEDPTRNQDGWLSSSPLDNARNLNGPLLLAQPTLDEKVHIENSLMLLDELLDNGKYADILLFSDRGDLFEDRGSRLAMFQKLTDFFVKNL